MDFRQIEAFVSVYRLRNFSRAGDALYLTQPAISNHINCLEKDLGTKLFDRSSRTILPTEAGHTFYQYAESMLETRENALYALNDYNNRIEGRLEIAASTIPSQYLLPRLMNGFRAIHPNLLFVLHQCATREVIRAMHEKKYQIGIVGTRTNEGKLQYEVLTKDRLMLITATDSNNQSGKCSSISLEDIQKQNFIMREPGSGTRQEFEVALKAQGINPSTLKIVAEMDSTEAIKNAVREGLGVSVVSSLGVHDYLSSGLMQAREIEGLNLERAFYLVTYKNRPLSPSAAAFRRYILGVYNSGDGLE